MKITAFLAILAPLFWLISPESLVLTGNSAGQGGFAYYFSVVAGFILSLFIAALLHHPRLKNEKSNRFSIVQETIGTIPGSIFSLSAYFSLAILLPTGILVTAGFTFNETFVYWFPNFGFSFLLLFTILFLQLAGEHFAKRAQSLLVGVSLFCLLIIVFFGIFTEPSGEIPKSSVEVDFSVIFSVFCTSLLLFIGHHSHNHCNNRSNLFISLFFATLLLMLWGEVSLKFVNPEKLAHSTIPYILTSREILHQPGRILMGITIIAGTCAAINGIFLLCTQELTLTTKYILTLSKKKSDLLYKIFPIFFSVFISISLTTGLAGSELIDTYIYGVLLLWMMLIGIQCFAATLKLQKKMDTLLPHYLVVSAVYPFSALYLTATHEHKTVLAVFCFLVLLTGAATSIVLHFSSKKISLNKFNFSNGDDL